MTWNAARRHCEADGAQLANLRNEWSKVSIELMALNLNTSLWIGLNLLEVQGRKFELETEDTRLSCTCILK